MNTLYYNPYYGGDAFLTMFGAIFLAFYVAVVLVLAVLQIIAYWKVFTKAGQKGWKSLIPLYADYVLFGIAWKKAMFWVTLAIALVSGVAGGTLSVAATQIAMSEGFSAVQMVMMAVSLLVMMAAVAAAFVIQIMLCIKLSRAFGYGGGFAVGLIFLWPVFLLILGFGKARYVKNQPQPMTVESVIIEE